MGRVDDPVMNDTPDGVRLGVVGDDTAIVDAVADAGAEVRAGDAASVCAADVEAVVAAGESALFDLVAHSPEVPVLPVGAGRGVRSVPAAAVPEAVAALVGGDYEAVSLPLLRAASPFQDARALCDVMLTTSEPAHISEFTVRFDGDHVARFRADGVVVATPAGSPGYARAADGPVVAPGTGVGSVVPVAPFATAADRWVVPLDGIELVVEREETPVVLQADDRQVGPVEPNETVRLGVDGSLDLAVVAESLDFYGDD